MEDIRLARTPLRRDLETLPLAGKRDCVVVDEIGGRFARVKRIAWEKLQFSAASGESQSDPEEALLWQQAARAGWTESRKQGSGRPTWSPLSIRIPIGSIDKIACRIVPWSGFLFTPRAIVFWIVAALLGMVILAVRWEHWSGSIPSLAIYLRSLHPLSVLSIFILTKSVHELGHAVACRRLGSRCGVAGIWFLCLMPCPYVDVTDVWRQSHPLRRAAVMAAGIAAEGVLCVIAIWVWALAGAAEVRLAAMNIILICGVSTVLFNANPLMRYDGYFILSDLVDSTNLREEARRAWMRLLIEPLSGWPHLGRRIWLMLLYHAASALYRVTLVIAIAVMLLAMADRVGAWRIAAVCLFLISLRIAVGKLKQCKAMWNGTGKWEFVCSHRRRGLQTFVCLWIIAVLCIPTPRYRHVDGRLRAADVHVVYLPGAGIMHRVDVEVGDRAKMGQRLARLSDPDLQMEIESAAGRARVLEHRARTARLASLQSNRRPTATTRGDRTARPTASAPQRQWEVLDAAARALTTQQSELAARQAQLDVISPADGIVLPPDEDAGSPRGSSENRLQLNPQVGTPADDRLAWCRIATSSRVQLALRLNAQDHRDASVGCPVRFTIPGYHAGSYRSEIASVSPLHSARAGNTLNETHAVGMHADINGENHIYQAVCEVPATIDLTLQTLGTWDGASCRVVVHLPRRALWEDLWDMAREVAGW